MTQLRSSIYIFTSAGLLVGTDVLQTVLPLPQVAAAAWAAHLRQSLPLWSSYPAGELHDRSRITRGLTKHLIFRTYKVSSPLIALYYTQIIGDARNPPTLLAASNFTGMAVIGTFARTSATPGVTQTRTDADPYIPDGGGAQYYGMLRVCTQRVKRLCDYASKSIRTTSTDPCGTWSLTSRRCPHLHLRQDCIGKSLRQRRSLMSLST